MSKAANDKQQRSSRRGRAATASATREASNDVTRTPARPRAARGTRLTIDDSGRGTGPLDGGCIVRVQTLAEADGCTPVERRVAAALLADPQEVVWGSISGFAARSRVSEAAVSRFVRKLGYESFSQFKLALLSDLAPSGELVHDDVEVGDTVELVTDKVVTANIRAIEEARRSIDHVALSAALRLIGDASRIAFFGYGLSAVVAQDARHHFLRMSKEAVYVADSHEQIMWAAGCRRGDVLMMFSHSGTSRDLCDVAEIARERDAATVSVTNHGPSPLVSLCDVNLFTSSRATRYREESLSSRIAALTLVDALYVLVALEQGDELAGQRDKIRAALTRKRLHDEKGM